MMGYRIGFGEMMNGSYGLFGVITWIIVLVDLVLLGFWLWKQINK